MATSGEIGMEKTKVRSWEIINELTLMKKTDKSIFRYAGATIPREMHGFFDACSMENGERRDIQVRYDGCTYEAHLEKENLYLGRVRIFWENKLKDVFAEVMKEETTFPWLIISKVGDGVYEFFLK